MTGSSKLPPLTWVRAFNEAARLGSFKAAAESLGVSPSTISHEIRKLEDWAQTLLFDRSGKSIALTAEGRALFDGVAPAFEQLATAFDGIAAPQDAPLKIGMFPFMASEVFMPRLAQMEDLLEGRAVKIASTNHLSDLSHTDPAHRLDAVIRYGVEPVTGFESVELTRVSFVPVSSGRADLAADEEGCVKRIRMDNAFDAWGLIAQAGIALPPASDAPIIVDNYLSGLKAVEQGAGIGIALLPLAADWISDGRLRPLSNRSIDIPERYWFVFAKNSPHGKTLKKLPLGCNRSFPNKKGPEVSQALLCSDC